MENRISLFLICLILCVNLVYAQSNDYFSLGWTFSSRGGVNFVDIADLGNDSSKEIIVGSSEQTIVGASGWIDALDREGKGKWQYFLPGFVSKVFVDDLDGDGKQEVIASVFSRIHLVDSNGQKIWSGSPRNMYTVKSFYADDINKDGKKELIVGAGSGSTHNEVYVMDSSGEILWSSRVSGEVYAITSSDLDGDGALEILVGCYGRGGIDGREAAVHVFNNTGGEILNYATEGGVASLLVDDIDSDGKAEILVGSYAELIVLDNKGGDLWRYATGGVIQDIISEDIDGDGKREIVLGSNDVYALKADGSLKWSNKVGSEVYDLAVIDLNKDGLKEVIVGSDMAYVLDSEGKTMWEYKTGNIVKSISVDDLENDGYLELAIGSADKNTYLFKSDTYAMGGEANKNYEMAESSYNKKDYDNAMNYAKKAKELYLTVKDNKGISDTETLIARIKGDSERTGQEESQADAFYNMSRDLYLAGDYINASKYAQKAKYKYNYLKNYDLVGKCDDLINNSDKFLGIESGKYLRNSSDSLDNGDYELAVEYAWRARSGYDYLKDKEGTLVVDELLAKAYYKLAELRASVRDFENASIFAQKSLHIYRCMENESLLSGVGCSSENLNIREVGVVMEEVSGAGYENSKYQQELLGITSLLGRISKEDTGNPADQISNMVGSNFIYVIVVALTILVIALAVGSLYMMMKWQDKSKGPEGLIGLEGRRGKRRPERIRVDEYVERSIDKVKKDRLKGEGLPIGKTIQGR